VASWSLDYWKKDWTALRERQPYDMILCNRGENKGGEELTFPIFL